MQSNGYQIKSGRFLKIYLMIMAWVVALIIIGFIVTGLAMCCCEPFAKGAMGSMSG